MGHKSIRRYLFTGGGTGGHVTPNLAIYKVLQERDPDAEFLYVGVRGKAESTLAPKAGLPIKYVRSKGYPGVRNIPAFLAFLISLKLGVLKSIGILLGFRPDLIVATGGYVSAPIIFAAVALRFLRLWNGKIFLHESNVVLGRLNALVAHLADRVGVSFAETLKRVPDGRGVYVGYPVRREAATGDHCESRKSLGIPESAKVVFAFGGSQGARTINRAVVDALPMLLADPDVWVIHGTGKRLIGSKYDGAEDVETRLSKVGSIPDLEKRYIRSDFFHDIGRYYAASDLAITRSGAGTVTELSARGMPSVLIPKANLPGDHQVANARSLERAGGSVILYEGLDLTEANAVESVDGRELAGLVLDLLNNPNQLKELGTKARQAWDPYVLDRIGDEAARLIGLSEKGGIPEETVPQPQKDRVLGLSSNGLDQLLRGIRYRGASALKEDETRLVKYKVDGFLADISYIERARGCRMAGLVDHTDRIPVLIAYATSAVNAKQTQCSFVRRDAYVGLGYMTAVTDEMIDTILLGMGDPYFETRAEAARAIARLARRNPKDLPTKKLCPPLFDLLNDGSFEVRVCALLGLGEVCNNQEELLAGFKKLYFDKVWKVRSALFDAMSRLVERKVLDPGIAHQEMAEVLITSTGYLTHYPLKEAFNRLRRRIESENRRIQEEG